jgi:bifunctional DNase/RNase
MSSGSSVQNRDKSRSRKGVKSLKSTKRRKRVPTSRKKAVEGAEFEWIELFPHGISVSTEMGRPVLVLKDKSGLNVLPVWIQPLDAGVALAELSQGSGSTPHAVARHLMSTLGLKLESCVFTDLVGHHQYVQLTFRSESDGPEAQTQTLRVRADESMSFCLQARARFYSTPPFMARCRSVDEDLSKFEQNLVHGQLPGLQAEMEISSKKHPYVM